MSIMTTTLVVGVSCDVRGCTTNHRLGTPVQSSSKERASFIRLLLAEGWAERIGRSNRWYCPAHADRAGRCAGGRWGTCSPHCPVHGRGQVITWDGEKAKRLAGTRSLLDADR